ncbi:hypothetical protein [Kitasatospora sp. NPDC001175]|uniref:hypothetical protein n=1 Tax=Kitasatospora sp. NPDC001175 TaxID=3157103 RepID=UPI003CFD9E75
MPYHLRFFFECGVPHTPLWPGPSGAPDLDGPYGSPCELDLLPITPDTRIRLEGLCERYQSSLDWDDPGGPSPWSEEQREQFDRQADGALETLRRELGDGWTVEDRRHPS